MNASASARLPVTGTLVMNGISGSAATDWTRAASLSRNARRTTGGRLRTGMRRGSMQAIFPGCGTRHPGRWSIFRTLPARDGLVQHRGMGTQPSDSEHVQRAARTYGAAADHFGNPALGFWDRYGAA